ncbi:phage tail protein [Kingella kingae]|uniref:phage tail protein n=1 Tax=Kingella kingae TaxID=504 RepID=UPI0002585012|nr:phage tail protein [Kingella kingae]EIC14284.1 tail completion protein R [Kingella kingae PYKK081]MBD3614830.1 phage tail protein [Kingella kingae]MBD3633185.1 phage tail protein [Kingella kingae]MBD3660496.1 phage tail protein [Kingella kingae]MDK4569313.1 phage tail protein [Kingella kingae]
MEKPKSLRTALETALPELRDNPDKLHLYITNGQVETHKGTLGHTDHYTLTLLITDFVGNIDVLKVAIINWLQTNQPDILGQGSVIPNAFTFEADLNGHSSADLLIELKLNERTTALIDEHNNVHVTHPAEPQRDTDLATTLGL